MAKQKLFNIDQDGSKLIVTYQDGEKAELDVATLAKETQERGMYHGFKQKLGDAAANAKGDLNYAKANIGAVIEALADGEWSRRGGGAGNSLLIEAVARVKKYDIAKAREAVEALSEEDRKALAKASKIAKAMLEIKQERLEAKAKDSEEDDALDLV